MNKKAILQYLHYHGEVDSQTNQLIDECIEEVKKIAQFKVVYQKLNLQHQPLHIKDTDILFHSKDLDFYFEKCQECMIIACTLGIEIDRKIKYYEHISMSKAIVFDAVSSRYLEECCDQYEKQLKLGKHTFRFAPGYGDLPLTLNKELSRILQVDKKLGISISEGGTFIPRKSMLGIIGIGQEYEKTCLSCIRKENCELRKGGLRCYVKD